MIIRSLTVFERETAKSFYLSLSPADRYKRFCCTISDETISKYVDRLDFTGNAVLGAFDEQGHVVGLAELVSGPGASEMAFSVRPDRRGQKIGTSLMERLLLRARICGARKVFVMFLADNTPMRRMAARAGMSVRTVDGESHAERELPPQSADALARWLIKEGLAHNEYIAALGTAWWGSLADSSAPATRARDKAPAALA